MSALFFHPRRRRLPRPRHWPAIGSVLAALYFLLAWSDAAVKVAGGASSVQIVLPFAMRFSPGGLYLALVLGLIASGLIGAAAGGAAAMVARLPGRRR